MLSLSASIAGPAPLAQNSSVSRARGWRFWSALWRKEPDSLVRRIDPRAPLVLAHDHVRQVDCVAGIVWVTQGDGRDYILKAGDSLMLEPADTVVVSAMKGAATVRYGASRTRGAKVEEPAQAQKNLSLRERECVALGAALASHCIPCIEFHVPVARKAGMTDQEISEALGIADRVRKVPAAKVMEIATALLSPASGVPALNNSKSDCPVILD